MITLALRTHSHAIIRQHQSRVDGEQTSSFEVDAALLTFFTHFLSRSFMPSIPFFAVYFGVNFEEGEIGTSTLFLHL
jgi:hypothetical protein